MLFQSKILVYIPFYGFFCGQTRVRCTGLEETILRLRRHAPCCLRHGTSIFMHATKRFFSFCEKIYPYFIVADARDLNFTLYFSLSRLSPFPMAQLFNLRRKILFWFLVILIFISGMSWNVGYWTHWFVPLILVGFWLIVDIMFFDEASFLFEPSYRYVVVLGLLFLAFLSIFSPPCQSASTILCSPLHLSVFYALSYYRTFFHCLPLQCMARKIKDMVIRFSIAFLPARMMMTVTTCCERVAVATAGRRVDSSISTTSSMLLRSEPRDQCRASSVGVGRARRNRPPLIPLLSLFTVPSFLVRVLVERGSSSPCFDFYFLISMLCIPVYHNCHIYFLPLSVSTYTIPEKNYPLLPLLCASAHSVDFVCLRTSSA